MSKSNYSPLRDYLLKNSESRIILSFEEIEEILDFKLPDSAYNYRAWWANDKTHTQAINGWLAAGYETVNVDLGRRMVEFVKTGLAMIDDGANDDQEVKGYSSNSNTKHLREAAVFQELARRIMSKYFGVELREGKKPDWPKKFDFVSSDYSIVGDAKHYTMVRGKDYPSAKLSNISEHVWLLEKTDARIRFLVFGNDKRVPVTWLKKYGKINEYVDFYFIDDQGNLEKLT